MIERYKHRRLTTGGLCFSFYYDRYNTDKKFKEKNKKEKTARGGNKL
jgi:hypothetical protein